MFESGLRREAIAHILNVIGKTAKSNANLAAKKLRESNAEYIVVIRHPRRPRHEGVPKIAVRTASKAAIPRIIGENPGANVLLLPIGERFADVTSRLEVLY